MIHKHLLLVARVVTGDSGDDNVSLSSTATRTKGKSLFTPTAAADDAASLGSTSAWTNGTYSYICCNRYV